MADAVQFLGAPAKGGAKPAAEEPDEKPADRPGPSEEGHLMPEDSYEDPDELAAQLDHADRPFTELIDRVDALEAELACYWLPMPWIKPAA